MTTALRMPARAASEAFEIASEANDKLFMATAMAQLAQAEFSSGELIDARNAYAESRALFEEIGDTSRVAQVDDGLLTAAFARMHKMIEDGVDRMKTEAGDVPLIAVGGGCFLVPDRLDGVSEVIQVPHREVANAVGAAIAQVSGEVDQIFRDLSREAAIDQARQLAEERAVAFGADAATLKVVEVEDLPLSYLPGNSLRTRVRVVGDIG